MAQQDISSSLEQQSFSPAKRGEGKIYKLRSQAEAKEAKIKKAEEKLAMQRQKLIEIEAEAVKAEVLKRERDRWQE